MNTKISHLLMMAILLAALALFCSGCTVTAESPGGIKGGYDVTDDFGHVTHFREKPRRIFCTTPSLEEILLATVDAGRIAAISTGARESYFAEVRKRALLVKDVVPLNASLEQILAHRPDLVIMQTREDVDVAKTFREMGISVFVMKTSSDIPSIRKRLVQFGEVTGEKKRMQKILEKYDGEVAFIRERLQDIPPDEQKIMVGYSAIGAYGRKEGLFNGLCEVCSIKNGGALLGITDTSKFSDEQLIRINPDILLLDEAGENNALGEALRHRILSDVAFQSVKAVQNSEYIFLPWHLHATNSQYITVGALRIAKAAYPDRFKE